MAHGQAQSQSSERRTKKSRYLRCGIWVRSVLGFLHTCLARSFYWHACVTFAFSCGSSLRARWIGLSTDTPDCRCDDASDQACSSCRDQFTWTGDVGNQTYSNWRSSEPAADGECVFIYSDGLWYGQTCSREFKLICKKGKIMLFNIIINVEHHLYANSSSQIGCFTLLSVTAPFS